MNTKRNILLIYTGGTIGMIKDSETGALQNFNFDELLKYIPELNLLECNIASHSFLEKLTEDGACNTRNPFQKSKH